MWWRKKFVELRQAVVEEEEGERPAARVGSTTPQPSPPFI
jgi:hypothetical protein